MYSKGGVNELGASPARIRSIQNAKLSGFAADEHDAVKAMTNVEIIQK